MSTDTLLAWASKPASRRMMSMVGLPTPQPLRRGEGPWVAEPLADHRVVLGGSESLQSVIAGLGAEVVTEDEEPGALVFDARSVATADDLRELYDFFHPRIRAMGRCGRVVVVGHPAAVAKDAQAAAASEAKEVVSSAKSAQQAALEALQELEALPGSKGFHSQEVQAAIEQVKAEMEGRAYSYMGYSSYEAAMAEIERMEKTGKSVVQCLSDKNGGKGEGC